MTGKSEKRDVYQIVTDQIISQLEDGIAPWQRSWAISGPPQNLLTRKPYRGVNIILLAMLGYEQNYFLTLKQVNALGGMVKKGERAHLIVFWNWKEMEDTDKEMHMVPFLRYFLVFNISQCDGLPNWILPQQFNRPNDPIPVCEEIVRAIPACPKIIHKGKQPFYNVAEDYVNMPKLSIFDNSEAYYGTLFHELIHSTGHQSRLNRKECIEGEFGNEKYSVEELVAEVGACYLKSHTGIEETSIRNSIAYIQGWLKPLKNDKRFFFYAVSKAQRAVDYILNIEVEIDAPALESKEVDLPY